jgi:hypothetical protein
MTDAHDEKVARDKAAVDAMRNAKSNMDAALARITTLEQALTYARDNLGRTKQYIGASNYVWSGSNERQSVHDAIDQMVSHATKALG